MNTDEREVFINQSDNITMLGHKRQQDGVRLAAIRTLKVRELD